jgi:hypothetical protein
MIAYLDIGKSLSCKSPNIVLAETFENLIGWSRAGSSRDNHLALESICLVSAFAIVGMLLIMFSPRDRYLKVKIAYGALSIRLTTAK